MRGIKILSSISVLLLLSTASVDAVGYKHIKNPVTTNVQKAGWDQRNLEAQTERAVYMRAQIEELTKQNEQLRNSLSQAIHDNNKPKTYAPEMEYETRIRALIEENKRLNKALLARPQSNSSANADIYAREIQSLKTQNAELQRNISQLSVAARTHQPDNSELSSYKKENENLRRALAQMKTLDRNEDTQEIQSLRQSISKLEQENRNIAQTLAEATGKALEYQTRVQTLSKSNSADSRQASALEQQLNTANAKIAELQAKLEQEKNNKTPVVTTNKKDIELLQQQNQSLRETIKSQSELLISSGNASTAAEQLISENLMLKRKLEQAGQSSDFNGKTAKQLFAQTQKLQAEVVERDKYIQELDGLKETVKQLRSQNDLYLSNSQSMNTGADPEITELMDVNKSLEEALEKERETTIAYRSKIREYQDEIESVQKGEQSKEASKQEDEIESLRSENEGLKSQIEILTKQSALKKKNDPAIFANMDKVKSDGVTYIDAPYPPVENVLPILGEGGEHIDYSQKTEVKAEDLLSQKPEPLSGGNN